MCGGFQSIFLREFPEGVEILKSKLIALDKGSHEIKYLLFKNFFIAKVNKFKLIKVKHTAHP